MGTHLFNDTDMTAIANAIRQKDGTQTTMTVGDMPTRIQNIPTGGGTDYMAQRVQGTLSSYTIPNTCTQIFSYAFYNLPITTMTIPNSVTQIYDDAFAYCTGLRSITIPSSVTSISSYAFLSCINLETVTFNTSSVALALGNFSSCYKLKTVVNFSGAMCGYNVAQACFDGAALEGDIVLGDHCTVGNRGFNNTNATGTLYVHLTQTDTTALASSYTFGPGSSASKMSFNINHCKLVVPAGMLSDYQSAFPNYSSIMIEETT